MTTSSSPLRARSTSARVTKGSARRSSAPRSVRVTWKGPSPCGGASGSDPSYTSVARACRASTPTGSTGRYSERHTGSPAKDCETWASTASWAATQPSRQASPPEGKTRLATTPSTR